MGLRKYFGFLVLNFGLIYEAGISQGRDVD